MNLGDFDVSTATNKEFETRVSKGLEGYGSSGDLEGTAACWKHDFLISVDAADSLIEDFCKEINLSDLLLVQVSEVEDDDKKVVKLVTPEIALPGRDEKLCFEVAFSNNSCAEVHLLSVGDDNE